LVDRDEDGAHPALAEEPLDPVLPRDEISGREHRARIRLGRALSRPCEGGARQLVATPRRPAKGGGDGPPRESRDGRPRSWRRAAGRARAQRLRGTDPHAGSERAPRRAFAAQGLAACWLRTVAAGGIER